MKDSKSEQESGKRKIKENPELIRDAVNSSDIQFFTYFPEKHRLEIHFLNTHYRSLPTEWDNYPESFISYMKMSLEDGIVYRNMISQLDAGASSASCTTKILYEET